MQAKFLERKPHGLSLLTIYRPNFCAECGSKIVRLRWRFWTSRRFCDTCAPRFRATQWMQRALVAATLVVPAVLIGRTWRSEKPPVVIQRIVNQPAGEVTSSPQTPTAVVVEQSYICGARTKKGTPCSRRVRGPVRCWQHKGAVAMLPNDKLIVKE